jgi:plasmanylethanolamine desaturase
VDGPTKHQAAELAAGYSGWHRLYESAGIVATSVGFVWLIVRLLKCPALPGAFMLLAALAALLFADFISGFVHWMFDTWGAVETPVFGRLAIRTFRHHHVDPKAITRHDFIETNGHNFTLSLVLVVNGVSHADPEHATIADVFIATSSAFGIVFVSLTSQIHKWAHMERPPRMVALLQRARLVLSPGHHARHHVAPHDRSYCITVGWLNGPLRRIRFFETLERVITLLSGAVPHSRGAITLRAGRAGRRRPGPRGRRDRAVVHGGRRAGARSSSRRARPARANEAALS